MASLVGPPGVRAAQSARRVPLGTWVYPCSSEKPGDALIALAKRGVVLKHPAAGQNAYAALERFAPRDVNARRSGFQSNL